MRRRFGRVFLSLILLVLLSAAAFTHSAYAKTIKMTGKYYQSDARSMTQMINKFRTGKQAWFYTPQGSKQKVKGLKKLEYDYTLEKIAMKRAAEIARSFSHTRPNGKSCFSAYPDGYMSAGENIAMGTGFMMTTSHTLEMWKETHERYIGQGHRRNMLSESYTCIGIACFEYNGCKYWVQEFGSPTQNTKAVAACDSKKTVKIKTK